MTNQRPPQIDIRFADLPEDPQERHEVLVDLFGRYLFWLRNWTVNSTYELGESEELRDNLGSIRRKKYDELANLSPEHRKIACAISEATVDRFIRLLLTLLGGTGVDQRLGGDHAIRFALDLEICEVASEDIVAKETISRGGRKFLADYWGRWLNTFSDKSPIP